MAAGRAAADHHQRASSVGRGRVVFADGQVDPFDYSERQYGGRRGAWRLLEIMDKHNVLGTWIICGATGRKISGRSPRGEELRATRSPAIPTSMR